jgi:hypothetical protein
MTSPALHFWRPPGQPVVEIVTSSKLHLRSRSRLDIAPNSGGGCTIRSPCLREFGIGSSLPHCQQTQMILFERDNSSGGPTWIEAESWGNGEAREPVAGI